MIDHDSRYADAPVIEITAPDGQVIRYVVAPILPQPDSFAMAQLHRVSDSDRPDTLAARHYGQATAWWLLTNANTAAHPDQLLDQPGDEVSIPMPDTGGAR